MTWEAWRHLRPARTLVVRTAGPACGSPHPERYEGQGDVRFTPNVPTVSDARWLLAGATTVYTAETWYGRAITDLARPRGVRTVLHVMPEYWTPQVKADLLLAPTDWQTPAGSMLLPVPVARDRFTPRRVDRIETLYHVASPAQDRNGTNLLLAALAELSTRCRVLIRQTGRGPDRPRTETIGKATVEWLPHHDGPYWEAWPHDADALVMPRRFAGLSLPMQEAAAQGLPVVALNRPPEANWLGDHALVPAAPVGRVTTWRSVAVDYWDTQPQVLAGRLDRLMTEPETAQMLAKGSDEWAQTLAWPNWTDRYRELLT